MTLQELPLLHFADLMLAILKAAGPRTATLDDAAELLAADRRQAREILPVDTADLKADLDLALRHAAAALLVDCLDGGFRITPRGRAVLHEHPDGIDDSVLMEFADFRDWLGRTRPPHSREDSRRREFLIGFSGFDRGAALTDNPFAAETAQHAAWEDGWLAGERRSREGNAPQPDGRRR